MIRNVILWFVFPCMIIAFICSIAGIHQISTGASLRNWLTYVSQTLDGWKLEIPKIPEINHIQQGSEYTTGKLIIHKAPAVTTTPVIQTGSIKERLTSMLNFFISVANFFIKLTNFIIMILNIVISILQFVFTMVYCVKDVKDYLNTDGDSQNLWWYNNIPSILQNIREGRWWYTA